MEVKASQAVPGQKGLFALTNISQNTMLGHYRGVVVLGEPDDDTDHTVRYFRIAAGKLGSDAEVCVLTHELDMSIDPQENKCAVYYINHCLEEEANAQFLYVETYDTRIVIASAKKAIQKGEEILAQYAPRYYSVSATALPRLTLDQSRLV